MGFAIGFNINHVVCVRVCACIWGRVAWPTQSLWEHVLDLNVDLYKLG